MDKLRKIAFQLLEQNLGKPNYKKYKVINEILSHDDCFKKLKIEQSYAILKDLKIPKDKIKQVYLKLLKISTN